MAQYVPVTLTGLICFNRMGLRMAEVETAAEESTAVPQQAG
jgi:hypothetical protein